MKADLTVRTIKIGDAVVRLPPGWRAEIDKYTIEGRTRYSLSEMMQPCDAHFNIPNSDGSGTQGASFMFGAEEVVTARAMAIETLASIVALTLHESMEWVTVDGEKLADPHPDSELNWEWGLNRCRNLVKAYIREFPLEDPNG